MTPAEFKARFTEFASESNDRIQTFIDEAELMFDQARWGSFYSAGLRNLVAHNLAMENAQTAANGAVNAGDTTMKKVGEVQVGKDAKLLEMQMKNPYMRTTYGQEYLRLRRVSCVGPLTV